MHGGFVGGPRGHEPGQRGRVLRPEDDLLFGRKVAEQRAGGHVGRRGDLLDRRGLDALIGEQPQRLRLDGAAGPLLLPFPQRRGRLIARQRPLWQPGTPAGLPLRHLRVDRRRADSAHRSRAAHPRALLPGRGRRTARVGLPHRAAARPAGRAGRPHQGLPRDAVAAASHDHAARDAAGLHKSLVADRPHVPQPADGQPDRPELRPVEIPAAGGIGSARAIASCFGELATGAKTLRLGGRTLDGLTAPGVPPADGWGDVVWHTDIRFSAGSSSPARPARSGPATARSAPRAPAAHSASPTLISASATPTRPTAWASTSSTIPASTPSAPPSTAAFAPHDQANRVFRAEPTHELASRNPRPSSGPHRPAGPPPPSPGWELWP
jgi:hypothetical protein